MINKKKYYKLNLMLCFCLALFVISTSTNAQSEKESVYKGLINIYKHVVQVSFNFKLLEESFTGSLTAKKGNKYKMVIGDRIIVCNSKNIWNYAPKENKVVISSFDKSSNNVSIESMFFSFLDNFEPVKISDTILSKNQTVNILTLKPKKNFKLLHQISSVDIWVDSGTYDILRFHITEPQPLTWLINKLRMRKHADDAIFEFEPNKDCTIIDLR